MCVGVWVCGCVEKNAKRPCCSDTDHQSIETWHCVAVSHDQRLTVQFLLRAGVGGWVGGRREEEEEEVDEWRWVEQVKKRQ